MLGLRIIKSCTFNSSSRREPQAEEKGDFDNEGGQTEKEYVHIDYGSNEEELNEWEKYDKYYTDSFCFIRHLVVRCCDL